MQNLDELSSEILSAVEAADTTDALEAVRIDALGKKGRISVMMRELGGMDPEERKVAGQTLNKVKDGIAAAIETNRKFKEPGGYPAEDSSSAGKVVPEVKVQS